MTLAELLVTMMLLGIVVSTILAVLFSVQSAVGKQSDRSLSNDQVRLAVEDIDRQVRSGNLLYSPTNGGMNVIVYTQANGNAQNPISRCVQWKITSQQLQSRYWPTSWRDDPDVLVSPWRIVADHIVNQAPPANPGTPVPAFALDTSQSNFGNRILKIVILANQNANSGSTVEIDDSITARDTQYGFPSSVCSDVPPG